MKMTQFISFKGSKYILVCFFLTVFPTFIYAAVAVRLPFTSSMVLQRNMKVNVWGTAAAGETVIIRFNGQQKNVVTGTDKNWKLQLDPMVAGGPYTMAISGTNTINLTDIYVGEVWQCGGQSNMDLTLSAADWGGAFAADIAGANIPRLRYMKTRNGTGSWSVMTPATAAGCSATGFFFAKEILQNVDCVVGLMVTAVGGTMIEQWFDPAAVTAFNTKTDASVASGSMYNQFVLPVVSYGIRGTIWIQGEQNASKAIGTTDYEDRFKAIINGWRRVWGQGNFPFYFGQITGINSTQDAPYPKSTSAEVREGQRKALSLSETAMSVMLDMSGGGWHYKNKQEAGRRMSLAPRALLYGKTLEYSGPLFQSFNVNGSNVTANFTHAAGLKTTDGAAPSGFALAGKNGVWYAAEKSVISGNSVMMSSTKVPAPVRICYGWNERPRLNLYNSANLQASPFLSDLLIATSLYAAESEETLKTLSVFPNPVSGNHVKISIANGGISPVRISVSDLSGETLLADQAGSADENGYIHINISSLPAGTFIVEVITETGKHITKLFRQ